MHVTDKRIPNYVKKPLLLLFGEKIYMKMKGYRRRKRFYRKINNNIFDEKEQIFLQNIIKSGDYCFDIGANEGEYTFFLSRLVGAYGKVFSFEPTTMAFKNLEQNHNYFDHSNVFIFNYALGKHNGLIQMAIPYRKNELGFLEANSFRSHFYYNDGIDCVKEEVGLKTMDSFVSENNIRNLHFIKCDVEGAELQVFEGGTKTISEFSPLILCEIEERHLKYFGRKMEDVFNFFGKLEYESYYLHKSQLVRFDNYKLRNSEILKNEYSYNFFLIPKEKKVNFLSLIKKN